MKKVKYRPPQRPNEREAKRDENHRRVVGEINDALDERDAYVDALIDAITKLGLEGWEPPARS